MCAGFVVPVSTVIPTWSAKRKTTCSGVAPDARCDLAHERARDELLVRREEGEALIANRVFVADRADVRVPPAARVAAVLHERGRGAGATEEQLELCRRDVRDAEEDDAPLVVQRFERSPDFVVGAREAATELGPVQHERVDRLHAEMLERAAERLPHLLRGRGGRIVRESMILSARVRELRLEEERVARMRGEPTAHRFPTPASW
jgi:hypothetical protein